MLKNIALKNIITFPHHLGQRLKGVDKGAIQYSNHLQDINSHKRFTTIDVRCGKDFFNNINNLYNANKKISNQEFRLNIGGDHSMALATVAYTLNQIPHAKVVWMDAHADINTYKKSQSKNYHGMPLSFLTGLDKAQEFPFIKQTLPFDRLFYVGLRSIDTFEQEVLNKHNIQYFISEQVNKDPEYCNAKLNKFLDNTPFHFSFDVDCFDPEIVPHTGTAVKQGVEKEQGVAVIHNLLRKKTLFNMDLTEINPEVNRENLDNTQLDASINKMFSFIDHTLKPIIQ